VLLLLGVPFGGSAEPGNRYRGEPVGLTKV